MSAFSAPLVVIILYIECLINTQNLSFPDWIVNLTLRRFRLRTLLLFAVLVAIGIAAFKPFAPTLSVQSMVTAPVAAPFSRFGDKFLQLQLTVRNDGRLPVWLRPNDTLISDDSWFAPAGGPTYVELDIHKDNCTKLAAGETRTYDIVVHAEYDEFRLFAYARDWRGRDGYSYLGQHDTELRKRGEP